MEIVVNGKSVQVEDKANMARFLASRGFRPKAAIVEYNGKILPADMWEDVTLTAADRLEIVTFVGGG